MYVEVETAVSLPLLDVNGQSDDGPNKAPNWNMAQKIEKDLPLSFFQWVTHHDFTLC